MGRDAGNPRSASSLCAKFARANGELARANAKVRPRQPESAWIFGIIFGIGESARATREGSRARDGERGEENGMQG
jgi:hypothetical protein